MFHISQTRKRQSVDFKPFLPKSYNYTLDHNHLKIQLHYQIWGEETYSGFNGERLLAASRSLNRKQWLPTSLLVLAGSTSSSI